MQSGFPFAKGWGRPARSPPNMRNTSRRRRLLHRSGAAACFTWRGKPRRLPASPRQICVGCWARCRLSLPCGWGTAAADARGRFGIIRTMLTFEELSQLPRRERRPGIVEYLSQTLKDSRDLNVPRDAVYQIIDLGSRWKNDIFELARSEGTPDEVRHLLMEYVKSVTGRNFDITAKGDGLQRQEVGAAHSRLAALSSAAAAVLPDRELPGAACDGLVAGADRHLGGAQRQRDRVRLSQETSPPHRGVPQPHRSDGDDWQQGGDPLPLR